MSAIICFVFFLVPCVNMSKHFCGIKCKRVWNIYLISWWWWWCSALNIRQMLVTSWRPNAFHVLVFEWFSNEFCDFKNRSKLLISNYILSDIIFILIFNIVHSTIVFPRFYTHKIIWRRWQKLYVILLFLEKYKWL